MTSHISRILAALYLIFVAETLLAVSPPIPDDQLEFFESRIRPVLVEQCYACHNSTDNAEAGLAVDHRQALLEADEVVVPHKPGDSLLIAVMKHELEGLEMPEGGAKLDDSVIRDFEKWIEMGAPDPRDQPPSASQLAELTSWDAVRERRKQWWSFQPIQEIEPPKNESSHPVDRFILARLQKAGLQPANLADSHTLIRRLFITLIGLPPSPEEFEQWSRAFDQDPDSARIELVDRLLASDRFGERWSRHWMDWIRYAESHGSEGDPRIDNAWRYRDYLIRALNEDVPYDQLIREHVAGDLLDDPRVNQSLGINESAIGTSHWRMVFHGFAPTDALDEKVRFVDDQINAFTKAFLGLTVSCARCHDHKLEAIRQADNYALIGILGSCRPARPVIDSRDRQRTNYQELSRLKSELKSAMIREWRLHVDKTLKGFLRRAEFAEKQVDDPLVAPLVRVKRAQSTSSPSLNDEFRTEWKRLANRFSADPRSSFTADERWDFGRQSDANDWYRNGLGLEASPSKAGAFAITSEGQSVLQGIYPAGIYSHLISSKHAARLTSKDHPIQSGQTLWVRVMGSGDAAVRYVVQDYPRNGTVFPVRGLSSEWRWQKFDLSYWSGDSMHVEVVTAKDAPLLVKGPDRSWFGVSGVMLTSNGHKPPNPSEAIRAVVADREIPDSLADFVDIYIQSIEEAIDGWADDTLTNDQANLLERCIRLGWLPNEMNRLTTDTHVIVNRYRELENAIPVPIRVPGLDETVGREQPLYVRGSHKQPGDLVPRRFLEAFDDTPYQTLQSGRLELAENLLADDNPLTRRVIVNRLWHHLFGQGLVETPDNFGRLGAKPTHPELLDWLSNEMLANDWSIKQMIRLIVTSHAWQQSSVPTDQAMESDPANRLLSHANVRRMEAEAIRDSLLTVSGRLDQDVMYGPPVDGSAPRRSVYVRVIRNALDPFLRAFDFPEPFSAKGRRDITNVPAQSLTMMNAAQVGGIASDVARLILDNPELKSDRQRVDQLFLQLYSRLPNETERNLYLDYLRSSEQRIREAREQRKLITTELAAQRKSVASLLEPIRRRLMDDRDEKVVSSKARFPDPLARWSFDKDLSDSGGILGGVARGGAVIENGALVLRTGGFVTTVPIKQPLTEKTLEAWVRLDNLQQRGGGVMSVQSGSGVVFDSIVFGEQRAGHWLAGSDHFRRTQAFQGEAEREAADRFIHVAIAYHADGRVVAFRQGKPYGTSYASDGPHPFAAGDAIVSFGCRHLPPGGNRMLSGQINEARLYDRALTEGEIAASYSSGTSAVTREQVIAALTEQQQFALSEIERRIDRLQEQLSAIDPADVGKNPTNQSISLAVWSDIAHASLMMKEFIYVP
ncbi:MAG: DUF1553 domain-containing protein [Planctomycetota bacterium]